MSSSHSPTLIWLSDFRVILGHCVVDVLLIDSFHMAHVLVQASHLPFYAYYFKGPQILDGCNVLLSVVSSHVESQIACGEASYHLHNDN